MSAHTTPRHHIRRRATAAASGLAALMLVVAACGEDGSAEDAVGDATSAMGPVAADATSAVGDAGDGDGDAGAEDTDQEFLGDIRAVGVDPADEQDYLTRGRDACASLDEGTGYLDVLGRYNDAHPDAPVTEAPLVVAAGVKAFCSQHLPQLGQDGDDTPDGGADGN